MPFAFWPFTSHFPTHLSLYIDPKNTQLYKNLVPIWLYKVCPLPHSSSFSSSSVFCSLFFFLYFFAEVGCGGGRGIESKSLVEKSWLFMIHNGLKFYFNFHGWAHKKFSLKCVVFRFFSFISLLSSPFFDSLAWKSVWILRQSFFCSSLFLTR